MSTSSDSNSVVENHIGWRHVISRLQGSTVRLDLSAYRPLVAEIAHIEDVCRDLTDEELLHRSEALRARARASEPLATVRASLFALAREASRRALGQRPFDEQLVAALALDEGHVVEMQTGEGKTLTAVMPAALNAFTDRGVHILTFNDYLARRDAEWMGPVYRMLGLSVGYVHEGMAPAARRAAYNADITYVTAKEAGFDHLRDLLAMDVADAGSPAVQRRARGRSGLTHGGRGARSACHCGQRRSRRIACAASGGARQVAPAWRALRHR